MPDSSFALNLTHPLYLAGLVALPLLAYYFRRSLVDFARWQRLASLACRALIVVLLVLALAGLTLLAPTREPFVVFALDRSKSIGDEARRTAEEFVDQALRVPGRHRTAFVYFAAQPGLVQTERPKEMPALDEDATNLAAVIEVAAGAIPPSYVPHIVLLSDGNETDGNALQAAQRSGVPVSTVPLPARAEAEVQVSAVNLPAQVREGEPFEVEVVLDSNHEDEGILELYRGAYKVEERPCKIPRGEKREKFRQTLSQGGVAVYAARIRGLRADKLLENNVNSGLVFAAGKPRVLLLDSDPAQAKRHLAPALEQEGIDVEVRSGRGMPDSLAELQNYELLILSNVPATALTQQQMEVARLYVEELGGGLLMLGGDQSFGLGGYYKTVLEDILPVRSDFEKQKEKPSLAMILLIDRSGSMEGQKMELAKEAAKSAVALLGPNDKVGVIAFDTESTWICELHTASDRAYVLDQIGKIHAGGGTHISPSMEMAYETLKDATAKFKHVILLTDGEPNETDHGDFHGIAANMATARMTLTTVGVGQDANKKFLEELATLGKGRFYFTEDPASIPQIFARETVTASRSALHERPFVPVVIQRTRVLANIDFAAAPELLGHVLAQRKDTSEFILATEKGDPLLVWWRYGLGMTTAFTSDAASRWAADWISNWPEGYSKFWAQVVRHTMRKNEAKGTHVRVEPHGRHATVTLDAADPAGRFLNDAETELTVIDPKLGTHRPVMTQTAPGRYVADLETPHAGPYHLELSQKQQGVLLYRQSRGLVVGYPDELRLRPTNEELLQSLARVSGGTYRLAPEAVFDPLDRTARRALPVWPYLVMAAAILFLLDVALRRIDLARRRRTDKVTRLAGRLAATR